MSRNAVRRAAVAVLALPLAGCYARHFPLPEAVPPGPVAGPPTELRVGLIAAGAGADANVGRVVPEGAVLAVAEALRQTRRFSVVVYPYEQGFSPRPDLLLRVEVRSHYDEHLLANLGRQLLVGASLLLLQPALATRRDLVVRLSARAAGREGEAYEAEAVERLEYTRFQPSGEVLAAWTRAAVHGAAAQLARAVAGDPRLRAQPPRPRAGP